MLRIGDFSKMAKVSIRMLRHYDQIGLLKPACVDSISGYRSYSVDQLVKINKIILLRNLGFTLKDIAEMVDDETSFDEMEAKLLQRQKELETEMTMSQFSLNEIKERLQSIKMARSIPLYDINIKPSDAYTIVSLRGLVPHVSLIGKYCLNMYSELYEELQRLQIEPLAPEITFYHQDSYVETDLDMEVSVVIAGTTKQIQALSESRLKCRKVQQEANVASLIYSGTYEGLEEAIFELLRWIGRNEWIIAGELRELHLSGPAHPGGVLVEHAIIELQMPINKASPSSK